LIGVLEETLVHRRIHSDNTSNRHLALQKEIIEVIRHSLAERRSS